MANALEMKDICIGFSGVQVLKNVSLTVREGTVHGLVGENGAGKSTLIKILSGAYRSDSGTIRVFDEQLDPKTITPQKMIAKGVAVIYQEFMLTENMTVAENIFLGNPLRNKFGMVDYAAMEAETARICERLEIKLDPKAIVGKQSVAMRQMVEIAKAFSKQAKIIVLDEPTAVLGDHEIQGVFKLIHKLVGEGISFIYISHRLNEIFELVDDVTIIKDGSVVTSDRVEHFDTDSLIRNMIGRELRDVYPPKREYAGEVTLSVEHLTGRGFEDVSFQVRKGEILAIAGLVGAGRTEVLRAIVGADRLSSGKLYLHGKQVHIRNPKEAIEKGIGLLPEERKLEGLFLQQPVRFNISISNFDDMKRSGVIDLHKEREIAREYTKSISVRPDNIEATCINLSGGNQQKVVFCKWLNAKCEILLIDEPTRGVDVGAKQDIYRLIDKLVRQGVSVIMVSSELPEVLGLSDRVLVMHQGHLVGNLKTAETSEEEIMQYATGQHGVESIGA